MVCEKFFAEGFAAGENESAGVAASVRNSQQLEQAHHVLIEQHVAVKFLEQIEHNVRLELLDCITNWKKLVLHAQCVWLVPEFPEALNDVELGFERERFLRIQSVD